MAKIPDLQVVLPYKTLVDLLESAQAVKDLQGEISFRDQQIHALRRQISEIVECIGDIRAELRTYHD